jgi:hypothetical protein
MTPEEFWRDLCEKDDRASPEDYPDMALVTQDELTYMLTAYGDQRVRDAWQQILVDSTPLREAIAREARETALEEAAQLCDYLWVGSQGKSILAPKIRALINKVKS